MNTQAYANLELVTVAIEAIAKGASVDDLADAPLLTNWKCVSAETTCLVGTAAGHPIWGNCEVITSRVLFIASDRGYARTVSRWYRLQDELPDQIVAYSGHMLEPYDIAGLPDALEQWLEGVIKVANRLDDREHLNRLKAAGALMRSWKP